MFSSVFVAALAAPLLTLASPIAQPAASSPAAVCAEASSVLSAYHALSTASKFCTSFLGIKPATTTVTSTYTMPLTEEIGNPIYVYATPAPPATVTNGPTVTGKGAGTVTVTSVSYSLPSSTVVRTETTTVGKRCTTKVPVAKLAAQTACDCLGVTTPTSTVTAVVTTTGDVTIFTSTFTVTYSPSTTYAPITTTETTSTSTTYSTYVTATAVSTFYQVVYFYETKTATVTACTATSTVAA